MAVQKKRRSTALAACLVALPMALAACGEGVTAASESRRVVDERFAAGVADSTDVLDAEVALLDAELECTRLAVSVRLAEAALLRAAGQ